MPGGEGPAGRQPYQAPQIRYLGGAREFFQAIADAGRIDELVRLATELAERQPLGAVDSR